MSTAPDPPVSNRWLPVVGGVMMNMALGTFYANSYFLASVEKEFGWIRGQTSLISTIGIVMIATWFAVAGKLLDKKGPRVTAFIGGILFAAGFFMASQVQSLTGWYFAWALVGMGNGFGFAVPAAVGGKWFPDKRGLVIGLVVAGYGAGSGVFGPIAVRLINQVGWRTTCQIFSVLFLGMTMIGAYLLKNPPAGFRPAGWTPPTTGAAATRGRDVPTGVMLRTPTFWALWVAYALGTTAGVMVISQLGPFGTEAGHAALAAALALPITASGNAGGRLVSGWISDHLGRLNTLRIMLAISIVAMPALYLFRENVVLFFILLFVVYYCYGTQLSLYASTSADFYGTKNFGVNYGLLFLAWGVAGILGGVIAGRVHDATGTYELAFYSSAGISAGALIALFLARDPHEQVAHATAPAQVKAGATT